MPVSMGILSCLAFRRGFCCCTRPSEMSQEGNRAVVSDTVTVTCHMTHLPSFHGMSVTPSGRLPWVLRRPDGSLMPGCCWPFT